MSLRDRPIAVWAFPLIMFALALFVLGADAWGVAGRLRGILFDGYQVSRRGLMKIRARKAAIPCAFSTSMRAASSASAPGVAPCRPCRARRALKTQGASLVVLVVPLDRTDPASPRNLLALVPPGPSYDAARAVLEHMPSPDDALASALTGVKAVTGFALGDARPARTLTLKATVAWSGARDPFGRVRAFDQASASLDAIGAARAGVGAVNLDFDSDGKVRRMPLVFRLRDKAVPSLEAEVLRLALGKDAITLKSDDGNGGLFGPRSGRRVRRHRTRRTGDGTRRLAVDRLFRCAPERNISASA